MIYQLISSIMGFCSLNFVTKCVLWLVYLCDVIRLKRESGIQSNLNSTIDMKVKHVSQQDRHNHEDAWIPQGSW